MSSRGLVADLARSIVEHAAPNSFIPTAWHRQHGLFSADDAALHLLCVVDASRQPRGFRLSDWHDGPHPGARADLLELVCDGGNGGNEAIVLAALRTRLRDNIVAVVDAMPRSAWSPHLHSEGMDWLVSCLGEDWLTPAVVVRLARSRLLNVRDELWALVAEHGRCRAALAADAESLAVVRDALQSFYRDARGEGVVDFSGPDVEWVFEGGDPEGRGEGPRLG